jgi:prolyl-tRNA synthetase
MKQGELFTKTQKEAPTGEVSKNAQLLIRAGFVDKLMAGVYTFLPLGWRVMKKIENIIREEMEKAGGVEIFMPTLQPKENWMETGRWTSMDDLFKLDKSEDSQLALGPTHEEVISPLLKKFVSSYRDLPLYIFQFQNKFRNEKRAKSGIMRGREFLMKDLYSFHTNQKDLDAYYEIQKEAYRKIFERAGIGEKTYLTYASGGTFAKYSHEFQTITSAGEDEIYICSKCKVAINKEILEDLKSQCPECGSTDLKIEKAAEVGNIFKLGTKYSAPFKLNYRDENGEEKPVLMGCYGIGLSRVMGTIVEIYNDEKGILWPEAVAPFKTHLISLGKNEEAEKIYEDLTKNNFEVLYDDREISAGEKFADADLIGIPWRVVVSEKSLAAGGAEIKKRSEKENRIVKLENLINELKK